MSSASASVTGCIFCLSSVSASTVSDLDATAFSLAEGDSETFDFFDISASGIGGGTYEVNTSLAFSDPGGSVNGTGGEVYASFFGLVSGGLLVWDDAVQQVAFGNGGLYTVAFQQGVAIVPGSSATVSATVTLDAAPVPLPAAGVLLMAGLGGLAFMRRRKKA